MVMEGGTLSTLLLFAVPSTVALLAAIWLLQRGGRKRPPFRRQPKTASDRMRLAHLLHDEVGQKFAAARVNLSALRIQLRTDGLSENTELDAAMNLLDDGCRDLRTVSRLMISVAAGDTAVVSERKTKRAKTPRGDNAPWKKA